MPRLLWLTSALLAAAPVGALAAQALDVGFHAGVLDDGRGALAGQLAVPIAQDIRLAVGLISIRNVGPDASLTIYEAALRWTIRKTSVVRPYLISGAYIQRSRVGSLRDRDFGLDAGLGVGFLRGPVEPFLEVRGLKDGSVVGLYTVGMRVSPRPFATRTAAAASRLTQLSGLLR